MFSVEEFAGSLYDVGSQNYEELCTKIHYKTSLRKCAEYNRSVKDFVGLSNVQEQIPDDVFKDDRKAQEYENLPSHIVDEVEKNTPVRKKVTTVRWQSYGCWDGVNLPPVRLRFGKQILYDGERMRIKYFGHYYYIIDSLESFSYPGKTYNIDRTSEWELSLLQWFVESL
jgi:hypothetical protein